ncbi:hypothetical protein VB005_03643 [Metarhizium brunneum]
MEPDNEHDHKMADLAETLKGFSVGGSRAVAVRPKPPDQHWQPWRWGDEILPLLVALRNIDERAPEVLDYWEKYYRARHKGISKDDPRWLLVRKDIERAANHLYVTYGTKLYQETNGEIWNAIRSYNTASMDGEQLPDYGELDDAKSEQR